MQFNSSLRLIASFTVNDPCENGCCVSHHDFAFNRYPELKEILLSAAENSLATVALSTFDKTLIDSFIDLDIAKIASVDRDGTPLACNCRETRFPKKPVAPVSRIIFTLKTQILILSV